MYTDNHNYTHIEAMPDGCDTVDGTATNSNFNFLEFQSMAKFISAICNFQNGLGATILYDNNFIEILCSASKTIFSDVENFPFYIYSNNKNDANFAVRNELQQCWLWTLALFSDFFINLTMNQSENVSKLKNAFNFFLTY
jgi:hypothetical protein